MKLTRLVQTESATFGQLTDDENRELAKTLEQPWRDNATAVSCIPAGTYHAVRYASPHFGYELFQLTDVPGRSAVELHIGNTVKDTHGCILLGSVYGSVGGVKGVLGSRDAFARFMSRMHGVNAFTLTVTDV